eukprot:365023-Chlamydomonas_euryale.AAC.19
MNCKNQFALAAYVCCLNLSGDRKQAYFTVQISIDGNHMPRPFQLLHKAQHFRVAGCVVGRCKGAAKCLFASPAQSEAGT